jgi:hypothetical protein
MLGKSEKEKVMAHGERAAKNGHSGREYWSTRPCKMKFPDWGRKAKKLTHRAERREGKKDVG